MSKDKKPGKVKRVRCTKCHLGRIAHVGETKLGLPKFVCTHCGKHPSSSITQKLGHLVESSITLKREWEVGSPVSTLKKVELEWVPLTEEELSAAESRPPNFRFSTAQSMADGEIELLGVRSGSDGALELAVTPELRKSINSFVDHEDRKGFFRGRSSEELIADAVFFLEELVSRSPEPLAFESKPTFTYHCVDCGDQCPAGLHTCAACHNNRMMKHKEERVLGVPSSVWRAAGVDPQTILATVESYRETKHAAMEPTDA